MYASVRLLILDERRGYLKLLPRFATHPATGELDGVGIKRFPEVRRDRPPHKLF